MSELSRYKLEELEAELFRRMNKEQPSLTQYFQNTDRRLDLSADGDEAKFHFTGYMNRSGYIERLDKSQALELYSWLGEFLEVPVTVTKRSNNLGSLYTFIHEGRRHIGILGNDGNYHTPLGIKHHYDCSDIYGLKLQD